MQNITIYPTTFSAGNLVIDKATLERLEMDTKDKIICYINKENELVITKQKDICIFCGKTDCLHTLFETSICSKCREDLKEYSAEREP